MRTWGQGAANKAEFTVMSTCSVGLRSQTDRGSGTETKVTGLELRGYGAGKVIDMDVEISPKMTAGIRVKMKGSLDVGSTRWLINNCCGAVG